MVTKSKKQIKQKVVKKRATRARSQRTKQQKDKSIKQITNVNVTSSGGSGGGGSGGSSIPAPQIPSLMTASMMGQKVGEQSDIKRLTDLLAKQINKQSNVRPIFENEEIPLPQVKIESKPDLNNGSLLENVNTAQIQDEALKTNINEIEQMAQHVNEVDYNEVPQVEAQVEAQIEESKPEDEDIDIAGFVKDKLLTKEQKDTLLQTYKNNKDLISLVQKNTNYYYTELGKDLPLLKDMSDPNNPYYFKIINGNVIEWDTGVGVRNRALVRDIDSTTKYYYLENPDKISKIKSNSKLTITNEPTPYQLQLQQDKEMELNLKKDKRIKKSKDIIV